MKNAGRWKKRGNFGKKLDLGIPECMELVEKFGSLEEIIDYVRSTSDEPDKKGLTEERVDVLKDDKVVASFKTLDEAKKNGYTSLYYRIRCVSNLGRYTYLK